MTVPNRSYSSPSYRYGFQGQEKDDEVKGNGNSLNYKYRMHDPRVGRFFAVDPLSWQYSYNSPYAFSENQVIAYVELEGLEKEFYFDKMVIEPKQAEMRERMKNMTSAQKLQNKEDFKEYSYGVGRGLKNTPKNILVGIWTIMKTSWSTGEENAQMTIDMVNGVMNLPETVKNATPGEFGEMVGGAFGDALVAKGIGKLSALSKGGKLKMFSNKFPDDAIPLTGRKFGSVSINGGKIKIDGKLVTNTDIDFVIDLDGNLQLGRKHQALSGNGDVLSAGTMKIVNGQVKRIDNLSGHYQISPDGFSQGLDILRTSGVDLKGARLQTYDFPEGNKPAINTNTELKE